MLWVIQHGCVILSNTSFFLYMDLISEFQENDMDRIWKLVQRKQAWQLFKWEKMTSIAFRWDMVVVCSRLVCTRCIEPPVDGLVAACHNTGIGCFPVITVWPRSNTHCKLLVGNGGVITNDTHCKLLLGNGGVI